MCQKADFHMLRRIIQHVSNLIAHLFIKCCCFRKMFCCQADMVELSDILIHTAPQA